MQNSNSWYNKTVVVVLLLIFIFPVGLYALWKNEKAPKVLKIAVTVLIAFGFIISLNTETPPPVLDIKAEKEKQLINIAYSSESDIKRNLKDPSSYELIERDYKFLSDTIYEINITYSATNSFGGRIQNKYLKMGVLKYNPADTSFTNIVKFEK